MNIEPRPIIKIQSITEIVPNKYSEPTYPEVALKLSKNTETVVKIFAQTLANIIIQGGGARGNNMVMRKISKPFRIMMHLSVNPSGDYIQDAYQSNTWLSDQSEGQKLLHCTPQQLLGAPPEVWR